MNQKFLIGLIIITGIGSITAVSAYSGTISAGQGNFNNVLVTGTCSGCGGGEGSFTSYSNVLNETVSGTTGLNGADVLVNDLGISLVENSGGKGSVILINGTITNQTSIGLDHSDNSIFQSETGKYQVAVRNSFAALIIYKNGLVLQTITFDGSFALPSHVGVNISPNGKYITIYTSDVSTSIDRIQVWQGS